MGYVSKRNAANAPRPVVLPSGYTIYIRRELTIGEQEDLTASGTDILGSVAVFALIASWDLDDDEGQPLPLTVENLRELGNSDATALGEAMRARSAEPLDDSRFLAASSAGPAEDESPTA